MVPCDRGCGSCGPQLHGRGILADVVLSARRVHGDDLSRLDVQDGETNTHGETPTMTLATAFFGTVWGMALLVVAAFLAGVMFKDWFLKLITGGRWGK